MVHSTLTKSSKSKIDLVETHFEASRSPIERRSRGVTFTPQWIVDLMVRALEVKLTSDTLVVDVGAGAGRFALAAAHALKDTQVIAVESDQSLAKALQNQVSEAGLGGRVRIVNQDFLRWDLPANSGKKVFLGNPPYVRHHSISAGDKAWLRDLGESMRKSFSGLSGLHVYFILRCLSQARGGDRLVMILPSEWLETRYGNAVKQAIIERCASVKLYVFPQHVRIFEGTMTTSLILDLVIGPPSFSVSAAVISEGMRDLPRETEDLTLPVLDPARANWLQAARSAVGLGEPQTELSDGEMELGELFAIHRGQVTGMNSVWIADEKTRKLIPERFLVPAVTDAKEILCLSDGMLQSDQHLQRAIDLPGDLFELADHERDGVEEFLALAEARGASRTYIARHRRPWWRVGLKAPPAIIMSYMARRPPRFAVNLCQARLLNIAHGLYPKVSLSEAQLLRIVTWLNASGQTRFSRTYAGGLIKVEPGEARKIRIPRLQRLGLAKAA